MLTVNRTTYATVIKYILYYGFSDRY